MKTLRKPTNHKTNSSVYLCLYCVFETLFCSFRRKEKIIYKNVCFEWPIKMQDILAWYQLMKISSYLTTIYFCWFPIPGYFSIILGYENIKLFYHCTFLLVSNPLNQRKCGKIYFLSAHHKIRNSYYFYFSN